MVLIMVGSPVPGQAVLDVARLAGADPRLRVAFTASPGPSAAAVEALLRDAGTVPLPWHEAAGVDFGLIVAPFTPPGQTVGVPSIVLPGTPPECVAGQPVTAVSRAPVVYAYPHDRDRLLPDDALVGRAREEPGVTVVGDSTHDRLVASLPLRDFYRRALGVDEHRKLVVTALPAADATTASTGARCRSLDVAHRLLAELPSGDYYVLGVPEPGPGSCAGGRGLAVHLCNGLGLMPPDADWRAALVAADWVVGDAGTVTWYGTVTGVPVLLTGAGPPGDVRPPPGRRSALYDCAARLVADRPVPAQLTEAAARWRPDRAQPVIRRITSEPGRFNRNMRRLMYGLLRLPQPATIPVADPVSPPFRIARPGGRQGLCCPEAHPTNVRQGG